MTYLCIHAHTLTTPFKNRTHSTFIKHLKNDIQPINLEGKYHGKIKISPFFCVCIQRLQYIE